jgi:hypothetical protein
MPFLPFSYHLYLHSSRDSSIIRKFGWHRYQIMKGWNYKLLQSLRYKVAKDALQARVGRARLFDLAREFLAVAHRNLKDMKVYNIREEDESMYLHPLREFLTESKMCPASWPSTKRRTGTKTRRS